jgi:hypothetical protein
VSALVPDPCVLAPDALRIDIVLPDTRVGLGPLKVDVLEQITGVSIAGHLRPLLRAPSYGRSSAGGGPVVVYPVGIPEGEGLSVPIPVVGDVGFRSYRGYLVLIVPGGLTAEVERALADLREQKLASGARPARGADGGGAAEFAQGWTVWRMDLSPVAWEQLRALLAGETLGAALARVEGQAGAAHVMRWFGAWVAGGFFAGVNR